MKKTHNTIEKQVMHNGKIEAHVIQQSYLEYVLPISMHGLSGQKMALSFVKSITIVSV